MFENDELPSREPRRYLRPGYKCLLPVPLGKYVVKISSSENPTVVMIVYWIGRPEPSHWIKDAKHTAQVVFFDNEEKTKAFLNKLEKQ